MSSFFMSSRNFFVFASLFFVIVIYYLLNKIPDPPGLNGYFYLKQIWSLGENNQYYFRDYSLSFLIPAFFYKLGFSELTAFRSGVSLFMGIYFFSALTLMNFFWKNKISILLGAVLSVGLNMTFYELSFGFFKNLTAMAIFFLGINAWLKFKSQRNQAWLGVSLLLFIVSLFFHKSAFLLVFLFFLSLLLVHFKVKWLLWAGGIFFVFVSIFILFYSNGSAYLLYLLQTISGSPVDFFKWHWYLVSVIKNFASFSLLFLLSGVFYFFLAWESRNNNAKHLLVFVTLLGAMAWLPFQKIGEEQLAYRMILVFASLTPPIYLSIGCMLKKKLVPIVVFSSLFLVQFFMSRGLVHHFTFYSKKKEDVLKIKEIVKPQDHMTCPHGLEFFVDYVTGIRCKIYPLKDSKKVQYRMAFVPPGIPWLRARRETRIRSKLRVGNSYFVLLEKDWREVVQATQPPEAWQNHMELRPDHMYDHD